MSDVEFALRREAEAAKGLIAQLRAAGDADDADLVSATIEGETSLIEAVGLAIGEIDELEVLVEGLKAKEQSFAARRGNMERGIERRRALIEQALMATDQATMRVPTATVTIARRAPAPLITNEAEIPSRFWKAPKPADPTLDKKALAAALKANEAVPGATLDNGTVVLTIRRT